MGSDAKKTELVPGTLEMLILKTIERNAGPMHGYGIARYIKQISKDVFRSRKDRSTRRCNPWRSKAGQGGVGAI